MKIVAIKISGKELNKITNISSNDAHELHIMFTNKSRWFGVSEPDRYLAILDRFNCFFQVKYGG